MARIVIIGNGKIGNAIAEILRSKKNEIAFWDSMPEKAQGQLPLSETIPVADFVFLCVPSFAVPDAACVIKPYLLRRTVVISVSKGIEKESGETMDELLSRILPRRPFALLSGPMLAVELSSDMGGAAVIASKNAAVRNVVARLFKGTELRITTSADIHGVACAGILKNIYAIIIGAAEGMGSGYNTKGFLLGQAQSEIMGLIPLLGGARETASIPALMGDLFATSLSPSSNNHSFGVAIANQRIKSIVTRRQCIGIFPSLRRMFESP